MLRKRKRRRRRPKFWKTPRRRASLTPPAPSKTGPNHPPARPTPPNLQDLTDQPNGWKQAAAAAAAAPGAKGDEAPPVPPQAESTSARPKSALKPAQGRHTKSDGGRNVSFDEPTPEEKAKHAQERVDAARAAAAARASAGEGVAKGNANKSQQPPPPPNKGSMFKQLGHNQQSPDFFLLDLCSKQDSTLKEVFPKPQPALSPSPEVSYHPLNWRSIEPRNAMGLIKMENPFPSLSGKSSRKLNY